MAGLFNCYKITIDSYSRSRLILVLTVITFGVYGYIMLYSIPAVMAYSGGLKLFDVLPLGYNAGYAFDLLASLGETGRHLYLTRQIPADMIYPGLFAVTFTLLLFYFLKKAFGSGNWVYILSGIPLLAGLSDYLENIGIIIMLKTYPDFKPGVAMMTSFFSISKSLFTTVFWVLLIIGLAVIGVRALGRDRRVIRTSRG